MRLIDKDALVAEIHKMMDATMDENGNFVSYGEDCAYARLCELKAFIDSLEVKEVDLEKEIEKYLLTNATFLIGGNSKLVVHHIAKHFFELGIQVSNKAQKGE